MRKRRAGRWIAITLAACLAAFLLAGQGRLIRADGVAFAACPVELVRDRADADSVISRRRSAILDAAGRYDLPPEMLAAIIHGHQAGLTRFRSFTDCAGSALGADLSLGLGQIRISTAVRSDGLEANPPPPAIFAKYRSLLLSPETNIEYEARELRQSLDRDNRFPGIAAEELIRDPFAMALAMSEYRAGRQDEAARDSRIGATGLGDLQHMLEEGVHIFGRNESEIAAVRGGVARYLDEVYCQGRRFNAFACERWRNSPANPAAAAP